MIFAINCALFASAAILFLNWVEPTMGTNAIFLLLISGIVINIFGAFDRAVKK